MKNPFRYCWFSIFVFVGLFNAYGWAYMQKETHHWTVWNFLLRVAISIVAWAIAAYHSDVCESGRHTQ